VGPGLLEITLDGDEFLGRSADHLDRSAGNPALA
jgi:hypothetical protein